MCKIDNKVFGLTAEELKVMQNEILEWTDSNQQHFKPDGKEDSFRHTLNEGAALLKLCPNTKTVFSKIHTIGK